MNSKTKRRKQPKRCLSFNYKTKKAKVNKNENNIEKLNKNGKLNINEDGIEILKLDLLRENNDDRVKTSLTVFYETDDELQLNANITKNVRLNYLYLLLRQKVVGNETVK